ncbi:hypothetical protein MPS_1196 [Mycobacterium pseudoshottsii JCM 15466]|nr:MULTISPECIES: type VII secretion target [Mycobacterium ulcerans group]GAQ32816.1 hypothetical protein MPS_1196 [Mycobacterium pseudoshottsii JCM 15466]
MNEQTLQVSPDELMRWAITQEHAADRCASARAENPHAIATAESWGPLFAEARRATVDAVNAREATLREQEEQHRAMARQLRIAAARMEEMDAENRAALTISTD